jgi:hypothetical protein
MKTVAGLTGDLHHIAAEADALERQGADIVSSVELAHDTLLGKIAIVGEGYSEGRYHPGLGEAIKAAGPGDTTG